MVNRGQVEHARDAFDADAPRLADTAQIVALEIDDHDVLGPILRRREELLATGAPARVGALDGARLHGAATVEGEEPLGRVADERGGAVG